MLCINSKNNIGGFMTFKFFCMLSISFSGNLVFHKCIQMAEIRLEKELLEISKDPPPGCSAGPLDDNIFIWEAMIAGPYDDEKSPYAGGVFFLRLTIPNNYPWQPPMVKFLTDIYHPNVKQSSRDLCLNILSSGWSPDLTISKLLLCIKALLDSPDPNGGKLSLSEALTYNRTAADWTRKCAMLDEY
ncbi:ubiquitin-conjugating enzyme E2 D2B-like [Mytilus californianus]|uniref:ubiquitin-conjugating enzyme E2 D2B-like n=1 Tax=Mytilus californianus TaxID=6549 RepID=UPI0022477C4A|nr:ubiquitin-conjugating enzyme E2 D2B-like [Mytilus californianus]